MSRRVYKNIKAKLDRYLICDTWIAHFYSNHFLFEFLKVYNIQDIVVEEVSRMVHELQGIDQLSPLMV